ncbi:MAG: hypothetical protein AAGC72_08845 [Planctomycetota bacterium]
MKRFRLTTAAMIAVLPCFTAAPQNASEMSDVAGEVTIGERGSEQDPLSGRDKGLAIEPQETTDADLQEAKKTVPTMRVKVDPRVLGVAPGEPLPPLRREGEALRKRDGKLLPTGERGYAVFILDADPEDGDKKSLAMVLAPCMTLESMERLLEDRGDNLRFTVTGQIHTYRGVNYLLPTSQPRPWLIDTDTQEQLVTEPENGIEDETPAAPDASETEANEPEESTEEATPSADDVLQQLLEQRRDSPTPEPAEAPGPGDREAGPAGPAAQRASRLVSDPLLIGLDTDQPQAELKEEGQFIIARNGRLVRSADGSQALFVLDSDGPGAPEPPMILQACKLLETMEQTVQEQGDNVPFVITGQVFMYRGANYLLPTIVKREFDRGNLE